MAEPAPADDEVLIETAAIGVGGVDAMIRRGALAAHGFREGFVPGGEVAGTVIAAGAHVDPSLVGRRVWAFTGVGGCYAERVVAPVAAVAPLPTRVTSVDAVTIGSSGVVARLGLEHVGFAPGESVLVRGASGGLGTMAVQLAARGGASVVAVTTSSAERGERLLELGATTVLDRSGSDAADGGQPGFDVIVDIVAGAHLPAFIEKLNPNGRIVVLGAVAGPPPDDFGRALFLAFQKSVSFSTFSANPMCVPDLIRATTVADVFSASERGELRAVVHDVLPLEHAVRAHQMLDAGEVFGRLVLTPF